MARLDQRNSPQGGRQSRARIACYRCHTRKTRCDAADHMPCSYCASISAECVLIESQRGRYPRKRRRTEHQQNHEVAAGQAQHAKAVDMMAEGDDYVPATTSPAHSDNGPRYAWNSHSTEIVPSTSLENDDSPEMLYAQVAESSVMVSEAPIRQASEFIFLGEAFSLTYVVHDVMGAFVSGTMPSRKRLHFPILQPKVSQRLPSLEVSDIVGNQLKLLREKDVLRQPPSNLLSQLLDTYFDGFHPAYPIVEVARFGNITSAMQQSQLVLNSILMVAVSLCDMQIVHDLHFSTRHEARQAFYRQARILYDEDAEPDKISNICGTFLMSFWWGGPDEQKDSWHWLGISTSLAQSLGLHRTTKWSNLETARSRHWKVIWWSIRTRDVLVSGSLGRPRHILESDCDVELPSPEDLHWHKRNVCSEATHYFCQMAKLCCIMSRIINARYSATCTAAVSDNQEQLEQAIKVFQDQIPSVLRYNGFGGEVLQGLWPSMLVMAYGYATLLLCRPSRTPEPLGDATGWGNSERATRAALEITRVMEDILSASMVRFSQIHTQVFTMLLDESNEVYSIPALFNALANHVHSICMSGPVPRQLAEARAHTCMLGLSQIEESWPVGGWVLRLFVLIMAKLKQSSQQSANRKAWSNQKVAQNHKHGLANTDLTNETSTAAKAPATNGSGFLVGAPGLSTECSVDDILTGRVMSVSNRPFSSLDYGAAPGAFTSSLDLDFGIAEHESFLQWLDQPQTMDNEHFHWPI